jgi:hypothetical protein
LKLIFIEFWFPSGSDYRETFRKNLSRETELLRFGYAPSKITVVPK